MPAMPVFITNKESAESLSMSEKTIMKMVTAGTLTAFVDWEQVESKLLPVRRPGC